MLNQHQTNKDLIEKHNKPQPLADFLLPFIGNKKEVKILDVGSGAYSKIGSYLDNVKVDLHLADTKDFTDFWKKYNATPYFKIEHEDMEDLSYPDNTFDIVHCENALDHTEFASTAVREMIRICKPGGYVYIDCWLNQKDTGHNHKWNAKEDGLFTDGITTIDLKKFGFKIKFIDRGGESRYNQIIATLRKEAK
jgi:ubiquinone/menaquinone biosynthesis C-methylase UbiE